MISICRGDLAETKDHIQVFFDQYDEEVFGKALDGHADSLVLQAMDGEEVVGGLIAQRWHDSLHLSELAVDKSYRHVGIGHQLMEELENYAQDLALRILTVSTQSYQAQAFYEKFGYQEFGRLKDMPFKGTDKIYMVKYLTKDRE